MQWDIDETELIDDIGYFNMTRELLTANESHQGAPGKFDYYAVGYMVKLNHHFGFVFDTFNKAEEP